MTMEGAAYACAGQRGVHWFQLGCDPVWAGQDLRATTLSGCENAMKRSETYENGHEAADTPGSTKSAAFASTWLNACCSTRVARASHCRHGRSICCCSSCGIPASCTTRTGSWRRSGPTPSSRKTISARASARCARHWARPRGNTSFSSRCRGADTGSWRPCDTTEVTGSPPSAHRAAAPLADLLAMRRSPSVAAVVFCPRGRIPARGTLDRRVAVREPQRGARERVPRARHTGRDPHAADARLRPARRVAHVDGALRAARRPRPPDRS